MFSLLLLLWAACAAAAVSIRQLRSSNSLSFHDVMHNHSLTDAQKFYIIASPETPVTDKVTIHRYQVMYGNYLLPYVRRHHLLNKPMKFLEIGLGCDMKYGMSSAVHCVECV